MRNERTHKLVLASLFSALVCVGTLIHIPSAATGGYINLGDAVVIASGFLLGAKWGMLSGGVGSALADIMLGYAQYAPATFIIKSLMACVSGLMYKGKTKQNLKKFLLAILAEAIMVVGYIVFEGVFLGYGYGAIASLPGNISQSVLCIITVVPFTNLIEKTKIVK